MESNGNQGLKEQVPVFQKMVIEYVAFMQLGKCDWDGHAISHWFLLTVSVSYQSNQWWGLHQSSTGRSCLDVKTNCQNSDVKRNEGQWRRINSLNMALKMVEDIGSLLKYMYMYTPLQFRLKKTLSSSLPFGQSGVKFCLPWARLGLLNIVLFSSRTTCLGPVAHWVSENENWLAQ